MTMVMLALRVAVFLLWVIWPDKATHDAGMKKVMEDPRCDPKKNPMPFDGMRVLFGGFELAVEQ